MEILRKQTKQSKRRERQPRKLTLTPEIQALYFQCLAGKLHSLNYEDQRLIVQVFNGQFPALPRAARKAQQNWNWHKIVQWGLWLAALGLVLFLIFGCTPLCYAGDLASKYKAVQDALNEAVSVDEARRNVAKREDALQQQQAAFDKQTALSQQEQTYQQQISDLQQQQAQQQAKLTAYQQQFKDAYDAQVQALQQQEAQRAAQQRETELSQQLEAQKNQTALARMQLAKVNADAVSADIIKAAQEKAEDSMRQAWREGSEKKIQPVNTVVGPDGTIALAQNAPREIVMRGDGPGLNDRHTTITVLHQPAPIVQEKGKASLNHKIHGDDFSANLTIPEDTSPEALQVLESESNNITDRYREKLGIIHEANVMSYNTDIYELQTRRASSVLWALIPLLMTLSGCGIGIYLAVTNQKQKKIKLENHIIEG